MSRYSVKVRRFWPSGFGLLLILAASLLPAAQAEAKCDDIDLLCQINQLDQQLNLTNQVVSGLNAAVGGLSTQVATMQTAVQAMATTFEALTEDLLLIVGTFNATLESVGSETLGVTNDIAMRVEEGRRLFEFLVSYERDQYLAFVGAGCEPTSTCGAFRGEILALIRHVESTVSLGSRAFLDGLLVETSLPPPPLPGLNLSIMKQFLADTPGVVLYALYRSFPAITVEGAPPPGIGACEPGDPTCGLAVLNGIFAQAEEAFRVVIDLTEASRLGNKGVSARSLTARNTIPHEACLYWVGDTPSGLSRRLMADWAGTVLTGLGGIIKGAGYALESLALWGLTETVNEVGGSVAIQASGRIHTNIPRWIGRILKVLGAITAEVGSSLSKKVTECRERLNHAVVMCWLNEKNPKKENSNRQSTYEFCIEQIRNGASF